ncbi:hypothetical protein DL96DRAFT_1579096 [Flagelloscypha sp. PMI_526]|nr:hypothetical protein DL96DRAFT_1579096 [Flagelloscypha sp. PMI_526]
MSETSSSPAATTPTASGTSTVVITKSKAPLPSRNACLACRAQKTRCTPLPHSHKCARCFRHDLDCVHKKHARGPKRKNPAPDEGEPSPKRLAWGTGTSPIESAPPPLEIPDTFNAPVTVTAPLPPSERIEPPSFSLDTILCESQPDDYQDPIDRHSDFFDDPVTLNMLSEHKAEALFDFFYERMNPFISILDPDLHTPKYVRRCSSLLYTAILAVTSKFVYRDIYVASLRLAHGRLANCCINGPAKIEVIQAISLLTFYKEPSDENSWRRIGVSIRMAYELGLHKMYKRPLPDDEFEARKVLNRERTWLHLICFDRTTAYQRDLPTMISNQFTPDPTHWWTSVPEELRTMPDYDIDSSMAAGTVKLRIRKVHQTLNILRASLQQSQSREHEGLPPRRVTEHDLLEQKLLLKDSKVDVDKWYERWVGAKCPVALPIALRQKFAFNYAVLNLNHCITTFELNVLRDALFNSLRIENVHNGHCVSACLGLLRAVSDLAASGLLLYTQDSVAVGFATAILWLSLHSNVFESETLRTVDKALKEVKEYCLRASKQPKDAPAYFCRFIDRFGMTFSTALSRRTSPIPSHNATNSSNQPPVNGTVNGFSANVTETRRPSIPNGTPGPSSTSTNIVFPWDATQQQLPTPPSVPSQVGPSSQLFAGSGPTGEEVSIFDMPARQSLIDFFTFDQNYWTAVAPQSSLQNFLQTQTSPDQANFSPTTASALSTYLGW